MALFENMSMDDYNKLQARYQQKQAQNTAQNLANRQAALNAAQKKSQGGLVDTLVGLATGIKDKVVDAGATLNNMGKTVAGGIDEIFANKANKDTMADDSKRRNDIAKKYGYNSYSDALNDDNASQDFWNEIKESNKTTQNKLKNTRKTYDKSYGNVQDVDLNMAKGQALNTVDTVLSVIPNPVADVAGAAIAGVGDEYKDASREKRDVNWRNAGKNATIGGISALASAGASKGLGKLANVSGPVGKIGGSQLVNGMGSGAAAGAASGLVSTLWDGGTLEDALKNSLQGAGGGALAGGTMATTMGLAGKGIDNFRNKRSGAVNAEPVDAQVVAKNKIAQPQAKAIEAEIVEPVNNRRGIAIKDYNAGIEDIPVRVVQGAEPVNGSLFGKAARDTQTLGELYGGNGRTNGKYIDSLVERAKANLPEAGKTASDILYDTTGGKYKDATHFIGGNTAADEGGYFGGYANDAIADIFPKDIVEALRKEAQATHANTVFAPYGMNSRQDLPMLNRQEYYADRTGRPGHQGLRAEDIPAYMQDRMRNDAGKFTYSNYDNETIMREVFGDVMDKEQMYDLYEQLAQTTTDPKIYSDENLAAALATDPELNRRATQILADQTKKQINVQGGPAISDTIPVTDRTTRYTESTLPARTYETPTARAEKVMNAEPTAVEPTPTTTATAEAPTTRQVAVDPATQAKLERTISEAKKRQGQALLDQYGTLPDPVRRSVGGDAAGVLNTLYDEYGLKTPAEVQYAANHVTGKDGVGSKMTRQLAASAENVPAELNKSFLDEIYAWNGLTEDEAKTLTKQIQGFINKTGDTGYTDGTTMLATIKNFEGEMRNLKGENGTYHRMTESDARKYRALQAVKDELTDRLWANADISKVMTEKNLNALRAMYKDNQTWQDFVNNKFAKAQDGRELRGYMKPLVDGAKIVDGAKANAGSFSEAVAGGLKTGKTSGVIKSAGGYAIDKLVNSEKAKQKQAANYAKQAKNAEAQLYGEAPVANTGKLGAITEKAGKVGETAKNIAGKAAEKIGNATAGLNNTTAANIAIGGTTLGDIAQKMANRTIAQNQAEYAQNRAETAKAQQAVEDATNQYNTAQTLANNAMAATQQSTGTGATLDRIARAMDLAMQAGDMNAYGQLADLYKQAYSIYELQNPSKTKDAKALSANQSKALAASQQLEQLAQMTPDAGTVASNIPLVSSLVDLAGGNEYANQAEALATTLGYLLSGANIKESEAKRIGQSYVPTAFDSEAVRQQKLDRARQLIQSYMSDTGAIEA